MSRIGSLMSVGKQSMQNSQTALQTTSHNISNANTEGYTRQRVDQVTAEPITSGRLRIGQGSKTASINRVVNNFLTKQIQEETNKLGSATGQEGPLSRAESIFNESINKGLNRFMGQFFNAFRELANNPESQAVRAAVKESAKTMIEDFHRINDQLNNVQRDVDNQITGQVGQINGYVKEIASLNEKIQMVEIQGMPANDERDRRELLVKKLGELVNIRYGEGDNGKVSITAGNTAVLVSGSEYNSLLARSTPATDTKREGNVDVVFKNGDHGSEFVVTREFKGGEIGGAIEARDHIINDLHKKMDHLAYNISEAINTIHTSGYDRYSKTGTNFFNPVGDEFKAAENLSLNADIDHDAGRIAAALDAESPGDNRVAHAIARLQTTQILKDGTATVDDFYNGMVGEFAVITKKNTMVLEHQKNIVDQLKNVRESISGVSLDEETTDMVKFQKAFDASARLIKVADEMFDTVLNLKRL
jgi:flagellar hook-associated protein 1 FlgK